jgi:hypothetical protein
MSELEKNVLNKVTIAPCIQICSYKDMTVRAFFSSQYITLFNCKCTMNFWCGAKEEIVDKQLKE